MGIDIDYLLSYRWIQRPLVNKTVAPTIHSLSPFTAPSTLVDLVLVTAPSAPSSLTAPHCLPSFFPVLYRYHISTSTGTVCLWLLVDDCAVYFIRRSRPFRGYDKTCMITEDLTDIAKQGANSHLDGVGSCLERSSRTLQLIQRRYPLEIDIIDAKKVSGYIPIPPDIFHGTAMTRYHKASLSYLTSESLIPGDVCIIQWIQEKALLSIKSLHNHTYGAYLGMHP